MLNQKSWKITYDYILTASINFLVVLLLIALRLMDAEEVPTFGLPSYAFEMMKHKLDHSNQEEGDGHCGSKMVKNKSFINYINSWY